MTMIFILSISIKIYLVERHELQTTDQLLSANDFIHDKGTLFYRGMILDMSDRQLYRGAFFTMPKIVSGFPTWLVISSPFWSTN